MFATLTSKGQLTLPEAIRDRMKLDAGAILDLQIQADDTITARQDQPDARRIRGLLKSPDAAPGSLLVTDVVLVEAIWTLRSAFEQDKHVQSPAVRSRLSETAFAFEDREAVVAALSLFEAGSSGFADGLVVAKHARQGFDFTATFDRAMRKLPGVEVLSLRRTRALAPETP